MNQILQQRIEEAAVRYCQDKNYMLPLDTEPSLETITAMDAFVKGTEWLLEHMWISVDEALPEENKLGDSDFVFVKTSIRYPFLACYSFKHETWKDINHVAIHGVTHWMQIPELKGGEK